MKKNNFVNSLSEFGTKYEPELLMAMGISGLCFSVGYGIYVTTKAVKKCEKKKMEENKDKLTFKEIFKETWKLYLPVALSTAASIPCIIAGNRVSSKRIAALTTVCAMSETALKEYKETAKEIIGEEKNKEIEQKVSQKKIDESKADSREIILNNDDEQLFYDEISGRYFKSTWNAILAAANELNEEALGSINGSYTLNDWFDKIGLDVTSLGYWVGWSTPSYDNSKGLMKITLETTLTKDNRPCGSIHYDVLPYQIK